jgi:hypothetical protein
MLITNASSMAIATPASTRSHHVWSQPSRGRKRLPRVMINDRNISGTYHGAHAVVEMESYNIAEKGPEVQ